MGFDPAEHPVALQIGGSDPAKMAQAAKLGQDYGYSEININVGCPSDRVQSGRFGACLMAEPDLVAACFTAMQDAVSIPVTIKCRLGIDDQDISTSLPQFIEIQRKAGCNHIIVHARKAWLDGLSPKENRTVPPLDYDCVRKMKTQFPDVEIILNGGLQAVSSAMKAGEGLNGLMFGRAAYQTPWMLTEIDSKVYGDPDTEITRDDVAKRLISYLKEREVTDRSAKALIRHAMGLYAGLPGARVWRRTLSEQSAKGQKPSQVMSAALETRRDFAAAA